MVIRGDGRRIPLAGGVVQCVVTSPPYWGLRDYQVAGQIGLESSIWEYVAVMVGVFREVWRVLRGDGTVWLNLGDSYVGGGNYRGINSENTLSAKQNSNRGARGVSQALGALGKDVGVCKPKDLCGVPWRVAFALQADGWYLRSDVIWAKPNPMPESVTDRPTRSHEYLFLLSKSATYYYDADAIREPSTPDMQWRAAQGHTRGANGKVDSSRNDRDSLRGEQAKAIEAAGRNKRSVWTINSEPYPESHFATFPRKLVEPCILAGTPERGSCSACGTPWVRVTETDSRPNWNGGENQKHDGTYYRPNIGGGVGNDRREKRALGWRAQCRCNAPTRPALVYDPFLGSATVGEVCEALGRRWVGTELSMHYCRMGLRRTAQKGLFTNAIQA